MATTADISRSSPIAPLLRPQSAECSTLHKYACLRCRSRRVKCDKILSGCANCASHGAQCVYSGRRPWTTRKSNVTKAAFSRQLLPASTLPAPTDPSPSPNCESLLVAPCQVSGRRTHYAGHSDEDEDEDAIIPQELLDTAFTTRENGMASDGGRFLVGPLGKSRYIERERAHQVSYIETVLSSTDPHGFQAPPTRTVISDRKRKLTSSSLLTAPHERCDTQPYHPQANIMQTLWTYYCCNVDIMVKVIYKPAVEEIIIRASRDISLVESIAEMSLLFAIWLATTTSMSAEECRQIHGEDRRKVIRKYRYALEQSLTQARWMTAQDLLILQSLTLYLVFASGNSRSTWIITGIALSIAQSMGMHSDRILSSFTIVETEVRRRVWWVLCQIDISASENCGLQSHIPFSLDTQLPLHINDLDLTSTDFKTPTLRSEFSEMTLTLGKIEMANTKLRFRRSNLPRAQKEKIIRYQLQRFEEVYMKYFDWQCDAHRLYRLGTRLMMSRLWMMMYDAALCGSEKERIEESLILCNADVLEVARQLPHKYQKHGWFFRCGYTQWHAVSYLLIQLCKRQYANESAVERAWQVIEAAFADWRESGVMEAKNDHPNIGNATIKRLWRPLVRLLEQARMSRNSELGLGSPSANAPSTLNTEITPESDQFVPFQDTLIGDPFFGSTGLSMEMSWDDLNDWVQDFQEGLYDQSVELQSMECQDQGL